MQHFTAHRLRFVTEVQTEIELNEHQGSAIRGALFHALRARFCAFARERALSCADCALVASCPVATLVSTLARGHPQGEDRPRPYTIQPPLPGSGHPVRSGRYVNFRYWPGEPLTFGLTLYADAMALFPYVVLATTAFESEGLGRRLRQPDGRWRRGTLRVREVWAEHPLTGAAQAVLRDGDRQVQVPELPVTHAQIVAAADAALAPVGAAAPQQVTLHFLTPTRLIDKGQLVHPEEFRFRPLLHRLITRLEALSQSFSDTPLALDVPALLAAADAVRVVAQGLVWEEVRSYSTRRHADSPIGGLLGWVTLQAADWAPFWPWLLWGQFVQVGKDAVKGNGMYSAEVEA